MNRTFLGGLIVGAALTLGGAGSAFAGDEPGKPIGVPSNAKANAPASRVATTSPDDAGSAEAAMRGMMAHNRRAAGAGAGVAAGSIAVPANARVIGPVRIDDVRADAGRRGRGDRRDADALPTPRQEQRDAIVQSIPLSRRPIGSVQRSHLDYADPAAFLASKAQLSFYRATLSPAARARFDAAARVTTVRQQGPRGTHRRTAPGVHRRGGHR